MSLNEGLRSYEGTGESRGLEEQRFVLDANKSTYFCSTVCSLAHCRGHFCIDRSIRSVTIGLFIWIGNALDVFRWLFIRSRHFAFLYRGKVREVWSPGNYICTSVGSALALTVQLDWC